MPYTSAAALTQDLLFLFLLVVAPLWDYHDTKRLKRNPSSAGKIRHYKTLCAWFWTATVVALLAVAKPCFERKSKSQAPSSGDCVKRLVQPPSERWKRGRKSGGSTG
ncbi:MAG: hypothetical protein WBQ43_22825 [Terriglobales bacterium]